MKRNCKSCVCCSALAVFGLFASTVQAVTTFSWIDADESGLFTNALNWEQSGDFDADGVPDSNDIVQFDRDSFGPLHDVVFYSFAQPDHQVLRLLVGSDALSFTDESGFPSTLAVTSTNITETGRGLVIGADAGALALLRTGLEDFKTVYATLGSAAGSAGILLVQLGPFSVTGVGATHDLIVGLNGTGSISVSNGQAVNVADTAVLAKNDGSKGTVNVIGAGSTWTNNLLYVGYGDEGTLNVSGGGVVSTTTGSIGVVSDAIGTVNVTDDRSEWDNSGNLYVGWDGQASLDISAGGDVINQGSSYLGTHSGSTGGATVSGTASLGSMLYTGGNLYVGREGNGSLQVTGNGLVISGFDAYIGDGPLSTGQVTIENMGVMSVTNGAFYVGNRGDNASLNVKTKGQVTSPGGIIGAESGSTGSTVTLDDGTWTIHGSLTVGGAGNGTLTVMGGGHLINDGDAGSVSTIGDEDDSSGTVMVDGAGSMWNNARDLYVGKNGVGTLTIRNGGVVLNKFAAVGFDATSICDVAPCSTVTVDGAGSSWTNDGLLSIGDQGTGELHVSNGGTVSSLFGRVANNNTGIVTVDGMGSTWDVDEKLEIGVSKDGSMDIKNGGQVHSFDGVLGANGGSMGTVTVGGTGANMNPSRWDNANDLSIDIGSLTISGGAQVSNDVGNIASVAGETGMVSVGGLGSTWTNASDLSVGVNSVGVLNITTGGQVTNVNGFLGFNADSSGTVTINGAGSRWTNSGNLNIGHVGNGKLTVANGGTVEAMNLVVGVMGLGELHGDGNIVGNVNSKGLVSPGTSPGTLSIDGNFSQGSANAKLLIELASAYSFDQLLVTGTATLAGTLEVTLLEGFAISGEHSLTILTASAVTGEFDTELLPSLLDVTFDVVYNATSVVLQITAPVLPGDYNQDGTVDAADYVMWRKTDGTQTGYNTWRTHFGQTAGSGSSPVANAAVPEPATLVIVVLAAAGVCSRQRRAA